MNPNDGLNNFFDKLTELLRFIQMSKSKNIEIPEDIEKQLQEIESVATLLRTINENTLKQVGLTEEQVRQSLNTGKEIPIAEKRLIERSQQLKKEIDASKKEIASAVTIAKQREKTLGKEGSGARARKKKFRAMGGKKNWKPL